MNRVIIILYYTFLFVAIIWSWQSADEELKNYMFYTVLAIAWIQGNYLSFQLDRLKGKLQKKNNDE
jgi:hypothetical protein